MTAAFETLIYTDCVPGQGLQGTAGLQFQARSPGADKAAQQVVQSSLLYEPPDVWMRERRPVSDYPPSFAHVHDGIFATAAGVYLGKEANGGRQGNQLTHSIVTSDPAAYGLIRPAQLFGAPFWTDKPAASTVSEPIPAAWEPGPFDAAAAQEFVLAAPDGRNRLVTLVAAFDEIGGPRERRVLFIADDAAAVLRWIAAATLLVPQRKALTIGIKVFTLKPAYAPQPVIAVHPAWGSSTASVANDGGYVVVDLIGGGFTDLTSDLARRRVDLLLERDPYDVLDLVEYADRIGRPTPAEDLDLAVAMTWPGWPEPMPPRLARLAVDWLRDSPPALLPDCRRVLVDQLCERVEQWDRDILLGLDAVAIAGQVPADRVAAVRLALIRAELDRVATKPQAPAQPLTPLGAEVWLPEHVRAAEEMVADALRDCGRNSAFDALLRLAKHLGVAVRVEELGEIVDAFVDDWTDHPEHPYRAAEWQSGRALQHLLHRKLTDRVDAGEAARIGDAWWDRLITQPLQLDRSLDRAAISAAMCHGDAGLRLDLIATVVGRHATDARHVIAALDVLYARTEPAHAELRALLDRLPDGTLLPDHIFEKLRTDLIDRAVPLKAPLLDLALGLAARGFYRPPDSVRTLMEGDRQLARICAEMPMDLTAAKAAAYRDQLAALDQRLRNMWSGKLAAALMRVGDPGDVVTILPALGGKPGTEYLARLAATLSSRDAHTHLVTAFVLANNKVLDDDPRAALRAKVFDAVNNTGDKRLKALGKDAESISRRWGELWEAMLEEAKKPSLLSRLPRLRGGSKG